jgi:hypothetical protein
VINVVQVQLDVVRDLCVRYHGYGSAGGVAVYSFAVYEHEVPVAAFSWQPPPPGAAKSMCPEAPAGVLSLSRMVAVPHEQRALRHISKPLRVQMHKLIDRTRWPVLVTYSDEGQGHTGHVYKCSGWQPTTRTRVAVRTHADGSRASRYANGSTGGRELVRAGWTWVQRWEHWACKRAESATWLQAHGWERVETGRVYRSGAPGFKYMRTTT